MTTKNDGGPAFPCKAYTGLMQEGISIRDYFAAKAMQAYVQQELIRCKSGQSVDESLAQMSYEVADAMLAARSAP
jgi:hypothetical protein